MAISVTFVCKLTNTGKKCFVREGSVTHRLPTQIQLASAFFRLTQALQGVQYFSLSTSWFYATQPCSNTGFNWVAHSAHHCLALLAVVLIGAGPHLSDTTAGMTPLCPLFPSK